MSSIIRAAEAAAQAAKRVEAQATAAADSPSIPPPPRSSLDMKGIEHEEAGGESRFFTLEGGAFLADDDGASEGTLVVIVPQRC
jgi:hypothetical protein